MYQLPHVLAQVCMCNAWGGMDSRDSGDMQGHTRGDCRDNGWGGMDSRDNAWGGMDSGNMHGHTCVVGMDSGDSGDMPRRCARGAVYVDRLTAWTCVHTT